MWPAGVEPVCLSNAQATLGGNRKGNGDGLIVIADTHGGVPVSLENVVS